MSEEKKMTFKETQLSPANRQLIIDTLKEEGFSESQLNGMLMEQVWKLYIDSVRELLSHEMGSASSILEKNPRMASMLAPLMAQLLKEMRTIAEDAENSANKSQEKKKKGSE